MSGKVFYLRVQQSASSSAALDPEHHYSSASSSLSHKTWSARRHSASEGSSSSRGARSYWSYQTTEINMGSAGPSEQKRALLPPTRPESSGDGSPAAAGSSSQTSVVVVGSRPGSLLPTAARSSSSSSSASSASVLKDSNSNEVNLPKSAVELIAWAITECNTTTPTLTQIATHIQAQVWTYRDEELSVLIKMVQHHLNRNNPGVFLPVMSLSGHLPHNPNLARWAINRQAVTVGEDGSLVRRRHRSHAHSTGKRSLPSPFSSPSSASASLATLLPQPTTSSVMMSPPDGAGSGSGHSAMYAPFSAGGYSFFSPGPGSMGTPPPHPSFLGLGQAPHGGLSGAAASTPGFAGVVPPGHHLPFSFFGYPPGLSPTGAVPSGQPSQPLLPPPMSAAGVYGGCL